MEGNGISAPRTGRMSAGSGLLLALALAGLAACSDGGGGGARAGQEFQATLTGVQAVKKGSDEVLPIDNLPATGATLTLE